MANELFIHPGADAVRLETELGTRRAFLEVKSRLTAAMMRQDSAAADHWCAVGLMVVDAWKACPPRARL